MKWPFRSGSPDGSSLVVELTHPSGSVMFQDPEVVRTDDGTALRAMVDADTWRRIRHHDIFGAASRTQQQGPLPDDRPLRITLLTSQDLPDNPRTVPSEWFAIIDAMHHVDLTDSGLEGDVWQGVSFSAPQPWSSAITALADLGFLPYNGLPSATTVRRSDDELSIEFRRNEVAKVTHAQAVVELSMGDEMAPAVYELINGINSAVPFSVTMIDAGDLIVRESVADEVGDAAAALIAHRVSDLVDIITAIRGPVLEVARGETSAAEALEMIFG